MLGHALGLDHTNIYGALMYPMYQYVPNLKLHADDIAGMQSLYGIFYLIFFIQLKT